MIPFHTKRTVILQGHVSKRNIEICGRSYSCDKFNVITLEITTLGFFTKNIGEFHRLCRLVNVRDYRIQYSIHVNNCKLPNNGEVYVGI